MVDYDSQRHSNQLANNNGGVAGKKKDEAKMMKAKEQFDEVKRKFDLINSELHDELPALYNSRVLFLITNLQPYFAAEQLFHCESSKVRRLLFFFLSYTIFFEFIINLHHWFHVQVFSEMESIVDKLANDYQHQSKMLNYFVRNKTPNSISNNIQSAYVYYNKTFTIYGGVHLMIKLPFDEGVESSFDEQKKWVIKYFLYITHNKKVYNISTMVNKYYIWIVYYNFHDAENFILSK